MPDRPRSPSKRSASQDWAEAELSRLKAMVRRSRRPPDCNGARSVRRTCEEKDARIGIDPAEACSMSRSQKITFAKMRESGVRGLADPLRRLPCSHLIATSGDPLGLMRSGCRTSSRASSARPAASAAPMPGPDEVIGPPTEATSFWKTAPALGCKRKALQSTDAVSDQQFSVLTKIRSQTGGI